MRLENVDGYSFEFPDALDAFVFDKSHDLPMKRVDIVVEFPVSYLFVELKNYDDIGAFDYTGDDQPDTANENKNFKWLKNYLKYKFRDTFLYRYAESKVDKPIDYICLINFEDALNSQLKKALKQELPVGKKGRWQRALARSCQVLNHTSWARNFPKWPVKRLAP